MAGCPRRRDRRTPKPTLKTILKMLRAHQWLKNSLIAVPMVLSHEYFNLPMLVGVPGCLHFVQRGGFGDLHGQRFFRSGARPQASDEMSPAVRQRDTLDQVRAGSVAVLLAISFASASLLPAGFLVVLVGYLVITTAYSLSVKRMLLLDVLTLAGLYTMRILAGAAATGVDTSFWLLAFSVFFFLSLALVKRYVELRTSGLVAGERIAGRGYRAEDQEIVAQAGMASAFSSALVLALYIDSDAVRELYPNPTMVWPLAPIVLYLTMRVWILARRDELHDDPVVFIIRDWRSQMMAALGALMLVAAVLVK